MRKQKQQQQGFSAFFRRVRRAFVRVMLFVMAAAAVYAILVAALSPRQLSIEVGDVAPESLWATRDIVDTYTTNQNIEAARAAVEDKFRQDDTITADVLARLASCFTAMDTLRADGAEEIRRLLEEAEAQRQQNEVTPAPAGTPQPGATPTPEPTPSPTPTPKPTPGPTGAAMLGEAFLLDGQQALPVALTTDEIIALIDMSPLKYDMLKNHVEAVVTEAMEAGIKEEYLSTKITQINSELISPLSGLDDAQQKLATKLVAACLRANLIYDAQATEAARDQAAAEVDVIIYKKGQNIVREREVVTPAQYEVLKELGLIRQDGYDARMLLGLLAVVLMLLLIVALALRMFDAQVYQDLNKYAVLCLIFVMVVAALWGGTRLHPYLLPVGFGVLLTTVLMGQRAAMALAMVWSILAALVAGSSPSALEVEALPILLSAMASSAAGIYMVGKSPQRGTIMYAGAMMGLVNMVCFTAYGMMIHGDWRSLLTSAGVGLGNGLVGAGLCMATLPLWESVFGMVTPIKLLEICNPNQPLLKRLLLEASGTYHHSIMVGNLAERAAEAIGANVLLARAGAYYHDIGKLSRPYFFTENQMGKENPHDGISPELSARIIKAHPQDGLALAREYRLPTPVRDIILEHQGTTLIAYFYHKQCQLAGEGVSVDEADFRYDGPKPRSPESAILMLADSVEAAVRSMDSPSDEKVEALVREVIKGKLDDGQLTESALTLMDIEKITQAFLDTFRGMYHERVEYPPMNGGKL